MIKTVLASGNVHKLSEFRSLLSGTKIDLIAADECGGMPPVEESGPDFKANALIKASALKMQLDLGYAILSDDSGLEVDFLGGAPGVYSARYAGDSASDQQNIDKLLEALSSAPERLRTARFRCVLCWIHPENGIHYFEGACEGRIAFNIKGSSGFGYDPIFIPNGFDATFGELGESIKSQLSHRAQALHSFRDAFRNKT